MPCRHALLLALSCVLGLSTLPAAADTVKVAVAANFVAPMQKIALEYEHASGHTVQVISGATGKFYAQIRSGAPFDVLLAADAEIPARLVQEGDGVAGSVFTYAIGKLVLWSRTPGLVDEQGAVLRKPSITHVAYANPKLAPYGAAAVEAIKALGLTEALEPKLVQGENISQAYQFALTGNAEIGFVALSQVFKDGRITEGSAWIVPAALYTPIRQDAVVLKNGDGRPAVLDLMRYLRSEPAKAVIRSYGYAF